MRTGLEPLTITLEDVCFLHWPVEADRVAGLVPSWLEPDTADGTAWVSALPMVMAKFDAFGLPVREDLGALNVRTYVRAPSGDRGVYFLSVDATDAPAVEAARRLFRLPYHRATVERTSEGGRTRVRVTRRGGERGTLDVTYDSSGPTQRASPDTLASFLAERYRYFTEGPLGTRLVGSVGHEPWELRSARATASETGLLAPVGLADADPEPLAHVSSGARLRIGPPKPVAWSE